MLAVILRAKDGKEMVECLYSLLICKFSVGAFPFCIDM
jgi:hypothetical protein